MWHEFRRQLQRFAAVCRLALNPDVRLYFQQCVKAVTQDGMIVHDNDADGFIYTFVPLR
jgi:hypothetical protein